MNRQLLRVAHPGIVRFALAWLLAACAFAVQSQQLAFRKYTQADGLNNLATRQLVQTPDGLIWVATDGGLHAFDGMAFAVHAARSGLPDEPVTGVVADARGRIWVWFDRSGLYVGDARGFASVKTKDGAIRPDAKNSLSVLDADRIVAIVEQRAVEFRRPAVADAAQPWSARPLFSDTQRAALPALDQLRSPQVDRRGVLWFGCGKSLCSAEAAGVQTWGPAHGVVDDDWVAVLEDRDGRLWARGTRHLAVLEPGRPRFEAREPDGIRTQAFLQFALSLDARGRVFTSTRNGIARWEGGAWREFDATHGLPRAPVEAALADLDGGLWLSISGHGVWRWIGYDHFESWTSAQGLADDAVYGIVRNAQGRLVIGTDGSCQVLDETARRLLPCPYGGLDGRSVVSLASDARGGFWMGAGGGKLWHALPGQDRATLVATLPRDEPVVHLDFDDASAGWAAASANGFHRLDVAGETLQAVALPAGQGRVWESARSAPGERCVAGTHGLLRVSAAGVQAVPVARAGGKIGFTSITAAADGSLWAAADSRGVVQLAGCRAEGARWVDAPLVADSHSYFVRVDRRGWVWVGTSQGLVVFDGKTWRRIDSNDGLVWNDLDQNGFFADADGSVWVGTAAGMTHIIDPAGWLRRQARPLDLHIASASFGDSALGEAVQVAWESEADFKLRLVSRSHDRSARTEFQYRLIGLSDRWAATRAADIYLPALEPGHYRLEARAVDADHARESALAVMSFDIVPPWWRTTELRIVAGFLLAAALALVWWRQVLRLNARRVAMEAEYKEREALTQRATRDGLTGLWNRSAIMDILTREIAQSRRTRVPMAIAMLDVDHFKRINDTHGHLGGDQVLRELAARITDALRSSDWVGRYGGEELLAVLPNLAADASVTPVERLRECVADRPFSAQGASISVTVSVGFAWLPPDDDDPQSLIARADAALYEAKHAGRNRVVGATDPGDLPAISYDAPR